MADHIPLEICREILLRTPAKYLLRLRAVCKSWRETIDDPSFVKSHANKQLSSNTILIRNSTGPPYFPLYSLDLETLNSTSGTITATPLNFSRGGLSHLPRFPVATCNGLMLVPFKKDGGGKRTWEIWNPLTHERLELPQPNLYFWYEIILGFGLGYDCPTDDYKVVINEGRSNAENFGYRTHVYSLKSDSWRQIMDVPWDGDWFGPSGPGVFLNGALHWISDNMIYVFDVGIENFRQLQLPASQYREKLMVLRELDVLGGCLIMSEYVGDDDLYFKNFDVWEMKDYGSQDSWVKLFSFEMYSVYELGRSLRPVAYMKNKMQIFLQDEERLYRFDVASNSVKTVRIRGLSENLSAQSFQGSMFRLHDNCGVSRSVERKRKRRKGTGGKLKLKMKMSDSRLVMRLKDYIRPRYSDDSCDSKDSNRYSSSSEDEDY